MYVCNSATCDNLWIKKYFSFSCAIYSFGCNNAFSHEADIFKHFIFLPAHWITLYFHYIIILTVKFANQNNAGDLSVINEYAY